MPQSSKVSHFDADYDAILQYFASIETASKILDASGRISATKAKSRLTYINALWDKCCQVNLSLRGESSPELHETHTYFIDRVFENYESRYLDIIDSLQEITEPHLPVTPPHEITLPALERPHHLTQIPKISLPRFSGSCVEWPSFRDYFESLFLYDTTFDDLQRMHYLKACLDGEAATLVRNLPTTADNFKIAWEKLKSRYANPYLLMSMHITKLFNLKSITKDSAVALRHMLDMIDQSIQSLTNLGRPGNHWDDLLVHLILTKLDASSRKAWEMSRRDKTEFPTFETLHSFLNHRILSLESFQSSRSEISKMRSFHIATKNDVKSTSPSNACPICKVPHRVYSCPQLLQTPVAKRFELIRRFKLCRNCLSSGHFFSQCKSTHKCRLCDQQHHSLLHVSNPQMQTSASEPIPSTSGTTSSVANSHFSANVHTSHVVLATAWILVSGVNSRQAKVRALLDQGSTHSLICSQLITALGCETHPVNAILSGIGDVSAGDITRVAPLVITSQREPSASFHTDALVVRSLTSYVPRFRHSISHWNHLRNLPLADENPTSHSPIQLIIGADLYPYILREGLRRGSIGQPVAQLTAFGWILSGGTSRGDSPHPPVGHVHFASSCESVDTLIRKYWETDTIVDSTPISESDALCEKYFTDTVSRDERGRYIVRIPFIDDIPSIGESISKADRLLLSLESRLIRNTNHKQLYKDFLDDYCNQGHMTLVPDESSSFPKRVYLPHHPVFKSTSLTTKLRVVFKASSIMSNGKSLNNLQFIGPKLQGNLPLLLTRWRIHRFVYCADIEKMYRQILIHADDRRYQCIRWRTDRVRSIESFQLNTVTYGTASAPFLAQRVIQQLVIDEGHKFPLAAPIVRKCLYVDDCLFGACDIDSAIRLREQVTSLLKLGGFTLRKWAYNDAALLDGISSDNHGLASDRTLKDDDNLKVLGIVWNPLSDSYKPVIACPPVSTITKRTVLSAIARLYDPLGWFSPVVISAKIFMQELWRLNCTWDSELPHPLCSQWREFYSNLNCLRTISIPRWIHITGETSSYELHGFVDASNKAYAAVVYLRSVSHNGSIIVSLLGSKTKVAPLKELTIPRLELNAAVLLAQLFEKFLNIPDFSSLNLHCWSDSSIVLAWLAKSASNWKTYVSNRVALVKELVPQATWHHVSGIENPADLASRGVAPLAFPNCVLWFKGPAWLEQSPISWPISQAPAVDESHLEVRVCSLVGNVTIDPIQIFDRFSCWKRLLRVTAWIRRWIPSIRSSMTLVGHLSAQEITDAKLTILRSLQSVLFSEELNCLSKSSLLPNNSRLLGLNPFLDAHGILRVGGRLELSNLPFSQKHPVLLREHQLTKLIVRWAHARCLHGGLSLTLSTLRSEFWILQAKKIVRSVIFHCVPCARIRADLGQQLMGYLPSTRIDQPQRAFLHSGIDYAGPVAVRMAGGRGIKSYPAYLAIFVCFATKALHIEVVSNYSTAAFLAAFRRFSSRRGLPSTMYSDCGTNFQGADKEMTQAFHAALANSDFQALLAQDSISWRFIPPAAPHFGGLLEARVKSVKSHIKRVLLGKTPTFEELCTLTTQIEACLNSRPLSPLSDRPDDPTDFLIGALLTAVPMPTILDKSVSCLSRWLIMQQTLEMFWRRWSADYVLSLQHRSKWKVVTPSAVIGQLVLIAAENLPPTKWKLGRIIDVSCGPDGLVRVATVGTATSTYVRSIRKLAFLPIVYDVTLKPPPS